MPVRELTGGRYVRERPYLMRDDRLVTVSRNEHRFVTLAQLWYPEQMLHVEKSYTDELRARAVPFSKSALSFADRGDCATCFFAILSGFPLRSNWCEMRTHGRGLINGAFLDGAPAGGSNIRILPYGLDPLRFAGNTLVYLVPILTVSAGVGELRRHRRHRRGLCPWCAYPTPLGSVCPECGLASSS